MILKKLSLTGFGRILWWHTPNENYLKIYLLNKLAKYKKPKKPSNVFENWRTVDVTKIITV